MSTRFSHLSRNPLLFWIDLTKTLESETLIDEEGNELNTYYTDNHSDEYLYPTFSFIIKNLALNYNNLVNVTDSWENILEHFDSACFSYIKKEAVSNFLNFEFQNNDEIDYMTVINKDNKFKMIVKSITDKNDLIDLYLKAFKLGIYLSSNSVLPFLISYKPKKYTFLLKEELETEEFKKKLLKENKKIESFLNKLIEVNESLFKKYE